jgi:hypothetical protein
MSNISAFELFFDNDSLPLFPPNAILINLVSVLVDGLKPC